MAVQNLDTALTTLATLKVYLNIGQDAANTSRDTQLAALIIRWSGAISSFCGRAFAQTTYTDEIYDGDGTEFLYLRNWPITTPFTGSQSIYLDTSRKFGSGTILVEDVPSSATTGDYYVVPGEESQGKVVRINGGTWSKGYGVVKVTYQAGYAAGSIPAPVVEACHMLIARDYIMAEKRLHATVSESAAQGGAITSVQHEWPRDVIKLLTPYKAMRLVG